MSKDLTDAIVGMDEAEALRLVEEMLDAGEDPGVVLDDAKAAMTELGDRFACEEVFIPELIMGGEIMSEVAAKLKPGLAGVAPTEKRATVVLGTAQGDIHDIGKDIVGTMLDIAGFEVVDLGVDVKVEMFIETAKARDAQIIALSCLLTSAIDAMKATVAAAEKAGLRAAGVKLMIGGAPVTEQVVAYTGADGYGRDAVEAVALAKTWTEA
jgi:5-methyltetrahydrofolate--homocysteine methyltransferase